MSKFQVVVQTKWNKETDLYDVEIFEVEADDFAIEGPNGALVFHVVRPEDVWADPTQVVAFSDWYRVARVKAEPAEAVAAVAA